MTKRKAVVGDGATYVALLRGINVGGKNRLPMSSLVELRTEAGCEDVQTHIQSGNALEKHHEGMSWER